MDNSVVIDSFPESALNYRDSHSIVVIDVIRATTTATTGVSFGRRIFPVKTTDEAFVLSERLEDPLLSGELGGNIPYGFDMTNSPVQIAALSAIPAGSFTDKKRPIILLSSSGTQLLQNAVGSEAVYLACFRNISAVANHLAGRHQRIAVLGAGTRGQFRREDQMGCAWVAEKLVNLGYQPETSQTSEIISRWTGAGPEKVRGGRSEDYLRRSGQVHDFEFILSHIDDLDVVPILVNGELVRAS
ncbi:MAG: 2-phosphosulfolactate phosphatase [Desulfobacteraceae bacterium]|nr:2-phosphosulfolactate phosphatase [Desulfobacteraceae bacterium]MBC2754820.1 2-phosphosulfolactate phosphatase [Desulfobacteraceae bacterium]